MTEAEVREQIDKLKRVRASGSRHTRFGEREVTFRDDRELVAAIRALEQELDPRPRTVLIRANKGWE